MCFFLGRDQRPKECPREARPQAVGMSVSCVDPQFRNRIYSLCVSALGKDASRRKVFRLFRNE